MNGWGGWIQCALQKPSVDEAEGLFDPGRFVGGLGEETSTVTRLCVPRRNQRVQVTRSLDAVRLARVDV